MKALLTMYEDGHSHEGTAMGTGPVYRYRVEGMPDERASITRADKRWTITRIKNNIERAWGTNYESPEDALIALQKELDQDQKSAGKLAPNDSNLLKEEIKGRTTEHADRPRLEDEGQSGG